MSGERLERCWGVAEDGASIEVALRAHLLDELDRRWPPVGLRRSSEPHNPVLGRLGLSDRWLIVPDRELSGDSPPPVAWDLLESELSLFAASRLTPRVAVHSAAIAHDGSVLVVPATSEGGKSTLALAAHRAGATVLSDEYTLIDPATGLVTGWHRPLRQRLDDGSVVRHDVAVSSDPLPVGLIAAVAYDPVAGDDWQPISAAQATVELIGHMLCSRTRPDDALDAALALTRAATAVAGTRGDADRAIALLLDRLDAEVRSTRSRDGGR